jgi:hypothetical protein
MDTVKILRDLWRLRLVVAGVLVFAMLAGAAVVYKLPSLESRKYEVGVATARLLVDTPNSQVVEVAPKGSDSLGVRANLLASLMADGVVKSAIAERAGLRPEKLIGLSDASAEPEAAATKPGPHDYMLKMSVLTNTVGEQLPIIEIDTQAPSVAAAAKLAGAASEGLRDYLDSQASQQRVSQADRLVVTGLGAPQAELVVRGPSKVIGFVVFLFVFALGCAGVLGVLALIRGWRAASANEREGDGWQVVDDFVAPSPKPVLVKVEDPDDPDETGSGDWIAPSARRS